MRVQLLQQLVGVLILSACGAHMVSNPSPEANPYGPVNLAEQGGEIRYKSSGVLSDERRKSAYKQMYEACKGSYRIDGESDHPGARYTIVNSQTNGSATGSATTHYYPGGATSYGSAQGQSSTTGTAVTIQTEYRYIHFTCVPKVPAAPADSVMHSVADSTQH
jgi:hypothetical protein